ncbi:flagellar biosynthesis protein FlhF [Bacillota bacterium LX-D]|nr:flagellar biosynthesis protein FlhF [Bacillota bacterium LX-D]
MKVKRYIVNNMPEAMEIIKKDLGTDAVIISSRWVKQGKWLKFLGARKLEVTAALEEGNKKNEQQEKSEHNLGQEVAEVKSLLRKMLRETERSKGNFPDSNILLKWQSTLKELEISHEIINLLFDGLDKDFTIGQLEDEAFFKQIMQEKMLRILEKCCSQDCSGRIYAFVGPTGVGKTTTLAKLAAHLAIYEKKKIALLTIDTYRIGAVEQLKIYSEILNVPMEAVLTPQELQEAVKRYEGMDAILIDTAGRPSKNSFQLAELQSFLEVVEPAEIFLVVSCTAKGRDLINIAEDFKLLKYTKLIFTKTDETDTYGPILNLANAAAVPVAYLTTGQNVPEDIQSCKPEQLVSMILGAVSNG